METQEVCGPKPRIAELEGRVGAFLSKKKRNARYIAACNWVTLTCLLTSLLSGAESFLRS